MRRNRRQRTRRLRPAPGRRRGPCRPDLGAVRVFWRAWTIWGCSSVLARARAIWGLFGLRRARALLLQVGDSPPFSPTRPPLTAFFCAAAQTQWSSTASLLKRRAAASLGSLPRLRASALFGPSPTPPPRGHSARRCPRARDAPDQKNGDLAACRVKRGRGSQHKPQDPFSPSATLRAGFLAARGVLAAGTPRCPCRDSASCAASRVFFAAISASMPASVARSWSRADLSATISWTSTRRCALKAFTVSRSCLRGLASRENRGDHRVICRRWRAYRLFTVSFFFARSLLDARDHLLRALDGFDRV